MAGQIVSGFSLSVTLGKASCNGNGNIQKGKVQICKCLLILCLCHIFWCPNGKSKKEKQPHGYVQVKLRDADLENRRGWGSLRATDV